MRVIIDLPEAWAEAIEVIAQHEHRPFKWQILRMLWEGMGSRLDETDGDEEKDMLEAKANADGQD